MASKYPVKSGYKYSFYRTGLGEPLHQPGYEFDLTDPNCYLLKTEYNNLHDPHLKSFFYNKTRHSQLRSRGYITKDNKVKCSLQEFNQYNNYIHHRMVELNRQYVKEQEHIKKQIDSINRSNAKLMERIRKREQYKTQLLKEMEKNWRKNDLRLLLQMRKKRSQKLQPLEEKKTPVSGLFDDSGDVSSLSSYKTISVSGTAKTASLPVTTPNDLLFKSDSSMHDLTPTIRIFGDLEDVTSPIPYNDFSTYAPKGETVSGLDTSEIKTVSSTMSTFKETMIKSDLPVCDLQHFKDTYSMMFQKIFEAQSAYLSSVSGELVEIVFDKITSGTPGHLIGFTPVKTVAKETLHDIRGKSPCRYLISRLEVMSAASEIVENALSKWHEIAVQKFSIQYEDVFEDRISFKKLYNFFICANNPEEMYKATLPIATESILESSEEIVKIVLARLQKFAKSRFRVPFKQQSDSAVVASLKRTSSKSDDHTLETRLSDIFRPLEQSQSFLNKELDNLATSIDEPEHKVYVSIQELIKTMLNIIGADIDYDRRQETVKKIAISAEEKFVLYKYLKKNYTASKKEPLRNYSRILLLPKSRVSGESFTVPDSEDQFFRAVIEEVNVPGMVRCLEDEDKHGYIKADWIKLDCDRQRRGYSEDVNFVLQPLDSQDKLNYNCFLLNMFNCDHLMHSQNEFNRPLKVIDDLVSETLIKILKDLQYPIPEHLYDFLEFPNNKYDVDTTIKYQKDINTLLLPSDIKSFSHHLVEYILKMLYATSSYEKWRESFLSIFSQVEAMCNICGLTDCNEVASPSELCHSQEHIIWEKIAQTISAKIESFLQLKFKTYLTAGEIVDTDLMQSVPGMHTELWVHTKYIVTRLLGKIAGSIPQQQTHDQLNTLYELFSKDDTSISRVLISSLLDHICNEQFNVSEEEWHPKLSTSHECLEAGCALHNVCDRTLPIYLQKSRLLDIATSTLEMAFKQIMETIEVKSLKYASDRSTPLGFETDLSKCCLDSVHFLQMEIHVLSKYIVEDLINILCSAKQKMKEDKSLLNYQGSVVTGICDNFCETISNSVLKNVFEKFRGFISLAVKVIHPSSKNISEEIYFPGVFAQQNQLYGPAEDPKRKLKSARPKSNLYRYSKHLSREMLRVVRNQLEKISNNIRHSLLEDEDVMPESSSLPVFELEQISLHSSFSQDESITFPQDAHIMQNIETNTRRNIVQKICAHLKGKESVTPDIAHEVKKVMLMLYKQLLIDLSVPVKLTHSSQMSRLHQQLLSETLLTCNQHADCSPFSDSEVNDLSGDILKILSDIIHVSNGSKLHDRTDSSNEDILDQTYGVKPINPVFTKLKNFVISKIITLFCHSIQKPSQSETKKEIVEHTRLESYAQELADNILHQAEEHLHEEIKDVFPNDNFLPLSNIDIADHIVSVLLLSLKYTYQPKEAPNKLSSSGKEETQVKAIKCNAMEIAKMVEIIIRDTIDNLTTIHLSNITLDICAKNLASSVLALIERELEQDRRFMYGGKKYIIDKNTLATEIVNIILQKFDVKDVSCDTSLTNASYNLDNIYTNTSKYEVSLVSHTVTCPEPELSTLIQQVECVLHEVQTKLVLELKTGRSQLSFYYNETNESSPEYMCKTCFGFTRSDVEFVAKDIVEIIIAKLSKHLQNSLYCPNLSYEEHYSMLEPDDTPCFSEQIRNNFNNQETHSMDGSFVEDYLLSRQLVAAVSDKTTAFAATIALKCKPHLPGNVKNENVGTFLARVNNTSSELELYSKDITIKVLESIKPRFKSKLLHIHNMTQHEDIQATHLIDNILHELSFKYYSSSNMSEDVSSYNVCTESDIDNGEAVDHPKASTPSLPSSSCVNEQRRISMADAVSLTNSNTESDFENGEAVNHPESSTPSLPSSSCINEHRRISVAGVVSLTNSNIESDFKTGEAVNLPEVFTPRLPSSSSVNEQRRFSVRGVELSTSSSNESDFENGEAVDHPRASTPKPQSFSVNEQIRFTIPEVVSSTSSNAKSDTGNGEPQSFTKKPSSPSVNKQRSYNIRLHFL